MDYKEATDYLLKYTNYERELRYPYDGWHMNLERVMGLLDELGNPEKKIKIIHIAGSKGKGSTAIILESVLRTAGYKTGLFTSPHLMDFRERIRLNGELVPKKMVADIIEKIIPAAEKVHENPKLGPLTYFEILTAIGFSAFHKHGADITILETGLGGRYDATNVCDPLVSVLTPVSLDHTDILGETITEIAGEKSMIIKEGRPAVIAPQTDEAAKVFADRCKQAGSEEIHSEKQYSWKMESETVDELVFSLKGKRDLQNISTPLVGEHQMINAASAVTALDTISEMGFEISDDHVRNGLKTVVWPARFERIRQSPDLVLDGAHNASSAGYLRDILKRVYPDKNIITVLGLGGDKDVEGFCKELGPAINTVIITHSKAMKAVEAKRIMDAFSDFDLDFIEADSVDMAMDKASEIAKDKDVILVTGSFYVISETLEWKENK